MRHVLSSFVAALFCVVPGFAQDQRPPNLIFIMADDLGWGDLGCFGQEQVKTPRLDQMAKEGMRLTDFYSGSTVCAPSRCVLMTGLHTGHCLIRGNGRDPLRPEDFTVAELFQDNGYQTGLVGKWGLGEEGSTGIPTRQGFDSFFGYLNQRHAHNYYPTFLYRDEERIALPNVVPNEDKLGAGRASEMVVYSHDLFTEEALEFVEANRERPFFLYLALTIPHANNEARKLGMEVPDLGAYADEDWPEPQKGHAAMVTRMDRDVGSLLDRLGELGIDEQTLVIFTSDNGPHAEGGYKPRPRNSSGPFRGIKRALYEGGIRVPTIARWPGRIRPGTTSAHIAYQGDLMATAADLVGVEAPEGVDSISFLPTLVGDGEQRQHEALYWEFYEYGSAQAVRAGRWKAVRKPMLTGSVELYDLTEDPGEKSNVAAEHPEVVEQMLALMERNHAPSKRWKVPKKR